MSSAGRLPPLVCLAALIVSAACLTNAAIINLDDASCRSALARAISTILVGQKEPPEIADRLAADAVETMDPTEIRFRPLSVSSPSGTDYIFVVRLKSSGCLLRLYAREKGSWSYTNNLTYIATEPLPGCKCICGPKLREWYRVGVHLR